MGICLQTLTKDTIKIALNAMMEKAFLSEIVI